MDTKLTNPVIAKNTEKIAKLQRQIQAEKDKCEHDFEEVSCNDIWEYSGFSHYEIWYECRKCGESEMRVKD